MRKLVLGFAAMALVLGVNAFYIWRAHPLPHSAVAPASDDPRPHPDSRTFINAPAMADLRATAVNAAPAAGRATRADLARAFLRKYHNPAGREELFRQSLRASRPEYADLAQALGLEPDEADALIELLVRQDLAREELVMQCMAEDGCRDTDLQLSLGEAQNREIADRFGPDIPDKLALYGESRPERRVVGLLRERLPDTAQLSDAKADQLIRALVEESRRIRQDLADAGEPGVDATNLGVFVAANPGDTAAASAAQSFNRRKLLVAAGVLNGPQLAALQKLFDDTMGLQPLAGQGR